MTIEAAEHQRRADEAQKAVEARAAYEAYAEADGTDLVDFVLDVDMLARAEGLVQKVWVVTQHESDSDGVGIVKVVGDEKTALDYMAEEEIKKDNAGVEGVWWEAHQYEVSD